MPNLSSDYPVSSEQIESFQRDGHLLLRGVCSPEEIAAYRPVINEAADRFNTETRPLEERDTYGKAFLQIMNLWERDEAVRRFTLARRFAKIAADLLGVDGVRIYHDQALFKEPNGGPTPWHQDQSYWPLDTDNTVTMWMPLVPILRRVGTMTFATGTHKMGEVRPVNEDAPISDASDREIGQIVTERGIPTHNYREMQPGGATWHYGWTLHCAPGNPTPDIREVFTIIYHAADARITAPQNKFHRQDTARWLPDLQPGDPAASRLNPLAYSRSGA